jgi:hypothetical protein
MVRILVMAAFISMGAAAQIQITLTPQPALATKKVLGGAKTIFPWSVDVCVPPGTSQTRIVSRAQIVTGQTRVKFLRKSLANDVLTRQVNSNPHSIIGTQGDAILGFAGEGLALGGVASTASPVTWAGLGLMAVKFAFGLFAKSAPDASRYIEEQLPDSISLVRSQTDTVCGSGWYLFAGATHDPEIVQYVIP